MALSRKLICKIIETKDIRTCLKGGIDKLYLDPEGSLQWEVIREHYEMFSEVPSAEHFKEHLWPDYVHSPPSDSLDALLDAIKEQNLGSAIDKAVYKVADLNQSSPWEAKKIFMDLSQRICSQNSRTGKAHVAGEYADKFFQKLKDTKHGNGLLGMPWPWEHLNDMSAGLREGNVFYIYGRQKSRKTWLMVYLALHFWKLGKKVLFFTREMTHEEIEERMYTMLAQLSFGQVMKAKDLTVDDIEALEEAASDLRASSRFIITEMGDGMAGFKSEIEEHDPDIVFHDYFVAIAEDAMGAKVTAHRQHVEGAINSIVNYIGEKAIPCILCGHANRQGSKTTGLNDQEHAWSDHITRRLDAAFRVVTDRTENKMALFVNPGRSIEDGVGVTLDVSLCEGFGTQLDTDYTWAFSLHDKQDAENIVKAANPPPGGGAPLNVSSFKKKRKR